MKAPKSRAGSICRRHQPRPAAMPQPTARSMPADCRRPPPRSGNTPCISPGRSGRCPSSSAPSAPPSPARPVPTAKVIGEHDIDVDAEARAPPRGSSTAKRGACEPKRVRGDDEAAAPGRQRAADHDDQQAIGADADAKRTSKRCVEELRQLDELLLRADGCRRRRDDRHENEADAEQHLVEMPTSRVDVASTAAAQEPGR